MRHYEAFYLHVLYYLYEELDGWDKIPKKPASIRQDPPWVLTTHWKHCLNSSIKVVLRQ